MRTLIAILLLLFVTTNAIAQESDVKASAKKQVSLQEPAKVALLDVKSLSKDLNLTNEQVVKIEILNSKVTKSNGKVTQKEYIEKLSDVLNEAQMTKWRQIVKKKNSGVKK